MSAGFIKIRKIIMSLIEERLQEFSHTKKLPLEFKDKNGFSFYAMSDTAFKDTYTGEIWLGELKESPLNSITSISASQNKLFSQASHRGLEVSEFDSHDELSRSLWNCGYRTDCLNWAWNHSQVKHGIISQELASKGIKYALIFSTHPPTVGKGRQTKPFKVHYQQKCKIRHVMLEGEFKEHVTSGRYRPLIEKEKIELYLNLVG